MLKCFMWWVSFNVIENLWNSSDLQSSEILAQDVYFAEDASKTHVTWFISSHSIAGKKWVRALVLNTYHLFFEIRSFFFNTNYTSSYCIIKIFTTAITIDHYTIVVTIDHYIDIYNKIYNYNLNYYIKFYKVHTQTDK